MMQLTLTPGGDRPEGHVPWTNNVQYGYDADDNDDIRWEKNRGAWALDPKRAGRESVLLVVTNNVVIGVWMIVGVQDVGYRAEHWGQDHRYAFRGYPLRRGDALFEQWVGRPAPGPSSRNPVRYLSEAEATRADRA